MTQQRRRLLVVVHVLTSVSGIGATLAVVLVLTLGLSTPDTEGQSSFLALASDILYVLSIPLLVTAVLVGVLSALYSPWGLFKHTWVLKKLVLTVVNLALAAVLIGPRIPETADMPTAWLVFGGLVAQLVLYLLATGLSVFKPKGLVRVRQNPVTPVVGTAPQEAGRR
nr:hypothetical protein [Kibdelosporangium sp. MJ126-NF4]CEL20101.1 Flavodoxin reductases (ferredoxin-NADPH reductases) family 1; Vanillate O-demethylase oxidoreductase [Kibdelosporangium sp. MJ126-NF4]CTQ97325.1 Flavodoxin reductases (ferredoxin-NADPH reductases) family 1; Vanillate O-demethylase oxidoreductase (EC 1.14.13.-) [Kibdelosporangium sp. MJ126-NF4]